jgi:putative flippase GtrA
MIAALLGRLPAFARVTYFRYIAASAGALAVDMGLFMTLIAFDVSPMPASVVGYAVGILAHWLLSSRAVFAEAAADGERARYRQKTLFLGSALVGLAITAAIVGLGDMVGVDPRLAKLAAIVVAFQTTYILRKTVVFS